MERFRKRLKRELYVIRMRRLWEYLFILVIIAVVWSLYKWLVPTGGELYRPDFKNGFDLYLEEGYTYTYDQDDWRKRIYYETPHSIWLVTDEHLKDAILSLCFAMKGYREYDGGQDSLGVSSSRIKFYPRVYLDTGSYCYKIDILNWTNYYPGDYPSPPISPIWDELPNEPLLTVQRFDLSLKPEFEDSYSYAKNSFGTDSLNRQGYFGWYSRLSRQRWDELLSLASSVNSDVAEIVWSTVDS